jgi:hypothetical protein
MKGTTFIGRALIRGLDTHRGGQHWECFCKPSPDHLLTRGFAHRYRSSSYPVAYSLVILPLTIARNVQFNHHNVPSAATFFGVSIFYLSGAINVLLFLIIRPRLLLFPRPRQLDEREIQLAPQEDTGAANSSDTEKPQGSPDPTLAALGDGGSKKDSATPPHVNSSPISDDV